MKLATLIALTLSLATSAHAAEKLRCGDQAARATAAIFHLNGGDAFHARVKPKLVSRENTESGVVLTMDVRLLDEKGDDLDAPYQVEMTETDCFIFSITMPTAA